MGQTITIVIPVYNVEMYLKRCLDSIVPQCSLGDVEVLLIDDGSTDSSGTICDEYSSRYSFIRCLHQENAGLSASRNNGIKNAKGKYIMFVDSDDYIEQGCLSQFLDDINKTNCDVLIGKSWMLFDDGSVIDEEQYTIKQGLYTSHEYAMCLAKNRFSASFCAQYHICKTDFLEKNDLMFYPGILHEDELWTPKVLLLAKSIYYTDRYFYYHYMRAGSIMHSNNSVRRGNSLIQITGQLIDFFSSLNRDDLRYFYDRMISFYLQAVYMIPNYPAIDSFGRTMPIKYSYYPKTIMKSLLYLVSPKAYIMLHDYIMRRRNKKNEN